MRGDFASNSATPLIALPIASNHLRLGVIPCDADPSEGVIPRVADLVEGVIPQVAEPYQRLISD